jgi:TPP-dependent pyruvate/acetoin dehydrogenase alpha subunit
MIYNFMALPILLDYYERMLLIRRFEELLLDLFSRGELSGTTHTCIGQEAVCVATAGALLPEDLVVSNHRCHGHYLARTGDVTGLLAEVMGREQGLCRGWGGSQHLHADQFYTNGILGSTAPLAAGMALAEKQKRSKIVTLLFLGDGAFGQGVVYETLNIASLWSLPLLLVVENNQYAQSTPIRQHLAGTFGGRAAAFNIDYDQIESNDVERLIPVLSRAVDQVRSSGRPFMQVVHTYRLCAHSKGDDSRCREEVAEHRKNDPLRLAANRLEPAACARVEQEVAAYLQQTLDRVRAMPPACFSPDPHVPESVS